ncbi:hypothetical protein N9M10_02010 [Hellea sp.]|nr:hypothetical protein [Hellea sp.]
MTMNLIRKTFFGCLIVCISACTTVDNNKQTDAEFAEEPTVLQLQNAVDKYKGHKILETVNCEGNTECYNAAFGNVRIRNAQCVGLPSDKVECSYEVSTKDDPHNWTAENSVLEIGLSFSGGGKREWLITASH